MTRMTRRTAMALGAGAVAGVAMPRLAQAAGSIVATTYPGSFDEAFKAVVGPAFSQATGADAVFTPLLNVDQIGKIQASPGAPPFDVVLFDEGPLNNAIAADILAPFPTDQSASFADIPEAFRHPMGFAPVITCQLVGLAYNPERVDKPTSWEALWDPKYKGRVGITGMTSSLGTSFMVEIAKMHGGSETDLEPAFAQLPRLLPNVGAIAPSPGALAALFQQGEVDIAFNYFNNIQLLKAKGVPVEFAKPETGAVVIRTSAQLVKNSPNLELAAKYLDTVMSPAVQTGIEAAPWVMMPTNAKVPLTGANLEIAPSVTQMVAENTLLDWTKFQSLRGEWIGRFNQEVKL